MRASNPSDGTDRAVAELASRQYGVVSRAQLAAVGLSRGQIQRGAHAGRLIRLHPGVYAVGHHAPRRESRWLAAVLACGEGAVLSHRSAGLLWGVVTTEGARPEVTTGAHRRTPEVRCHTAALARADVAVHQRIPVTSPARTLVDLDHVLTEDDLTRAVREAQFRRLFHLPSVLDALDRRRSRRLRELLTDLSPTQSRLEDRLLAICRRHRLPAPVTQQHVLGCRVDFLWPSSRVVVETDGYEAHATPSAFQRDRAATNRLQLAGYTILRFTHADLTRRAAEVAGLIRDALAR